MSSAVSAGEPAVVLRSSYQLVRTLLALATIVIVGLTVAVVVLAVNDGANGTVSRAAHNPSAVGATARAQTPAASAPVSNSFRGDYPGHH